MLERLFQAGPDRHQHFEVDFESTAEIEAEALLLAHAPDRTLLAFVDRDLDKPSWIPDTCLRFELYPGQIHEEFGFGIATLPEWLFLALDKFTYASLRAGRDERIASDQEKHREAAVKLRRQEKAHEAACKKAEKSRDQGKLDL